MCLARPWHWGFLARQIADWLSSKILVGSVGGFLTSVSNCHIQTASCAALANAVESATHVSFLLLQLIAAPLEHT